MWDGESEGKEEIKKKLLCLYNELCIIWELDIYVVMFVWLIYFSFGG